MRPVQTYQEVVWLDAKQFTEVSKRDRCIRLEAEVTVMMRRRQSASFAETQTGIHNNCPKTMLKVGGQSTAVTWTKTWIISSECMHTAVSSVIWGNTVSAQPYLTYTVLSNRNNFPNIFFIISSFRLNNMSVALWWSTYTQRGFYMCLCHFLC